MVHTYSYTYDATWKDELTSYDGNAIAYEQSGNIGNPYTYNGWTYTWDAGRQLKQMSNGTITLQYKYNQDGLRTQKINGSTTTTYYWNGDQLTHETSGSNTLHFWYDGDQAAMVTYNGVNYYYIYNLQGDVLGLIDASRTMVVNYTYDSWGKQLSCTGSLASTLGVANPLRYRGYIYDEETGLYYLQSRYYNPDWGRFINMDLLVSKENLLIVSNLFSYCSNNPTNSFDPCGERQAEYASMQPTHKERTEHILEQERLMLVEKNDELVHSLFPSAFDILGIKSSIQLGKFQIVLGGKRVHYVLKQSPILVMFILKLEMDQN